MVKVEYSRLRGRGFESPLWIQMFMQHSFESNHELKTLLGITTWAVTCTVILQIGGWKMRNGWLIGKPSSMFLNELGAYHLTMTNVQQKIRNKYWPGCCCRRERSRTRTWTRPCTSRGVFRRSSNTPTRTCTFPARSPLDSFLGIWRNHLKMKQIKNIFILFVPT